MRLRLLDWGLADGNARPQATRGARAVTLTEALRPKAHMLAWQSRRGARHNAAFCEPDRARRSAGPDHRAKRERSEWAGFAECRVMLKRARSDRFTPEGLCLCVVGFWLTAKRGRKRGTSALCRASWIQAWLLPSASRLAVPHSG